MQIQFLHDRFARYAGELSLQIDFRIDRQVGARVFQGACQRENTVGEVAPTVEILIPVAAQFGRLHVEVEAGAERVDVDAAPVDYGASGQFANGAFLLQPLTGIELTKVQCALIRLIFPGNKARQPAVEPCRTPIGAQRGVHDEVVELTLDFARQVERGRQCNGGRDGALGNQFVDVGQAGGGVLNRKVHANSVGVRYVCQPPTQPEVRTRQHVQPKTGQVQRGQCAGGLSVGPKSSSTVRKRGCIGQKRSQLQHVGHR